MTYQSEKGNFTIALAGDTMLTRKLTPFTEERFLKLREILRGADAPLRQSRRHGAHLGRRDTGDHPGHVHDDGPQAPR